MADFETNLVTIAKGRFGKDVRRAIYDTIKELYTVGSGYTPTSKSPLNDTSDGNIKGIRVRAHSTQNGTPAPNNPVDIVDASKVITTHNGSETDYKSSSITLNAVIFASVDDVADEIVIDAKTRRGIFYKRVTRNTFKNSITEKWREYMSATNQVFILETPNPKPDYTKHIYSDRFVYGIPAPLITTGGKIYCAPTDEVWLVFPANTFTNIDAFKSWLETNNVVVEYALKNPSEQILSEEQVDEILSLKTFEGTTYVDAETDVEITYSIGWKTYIDNADAEINERIDELASNPSSSLVLTNPSPLNNADGKKILGIDAVGRSWQDGTQKFTFTQGAIVPTVGSALNQDINANNSRCTSNIIQLPMGSVISAPSGYEIYLAHATTENGNIDIAQTWVTTYTTTVDGYWRVVCRNKNNTSANITPSECRVIANVSPTPTNPIPIIDASGEVVASTKNLFDKFVNTPTGTEVPEVKLKKGTYTVSTDKAMASGNWYIGAYSDTTTCITESAISASGMTLNGNKTRFYGIQNAETFTFTLNTDAYIVLARLNANNTAKAQIELGTTATSYVPYQSNSVSLPFEPKSVGSVANELIVNEDGSAKAIKNVETVDLGSLNWKASSGGNGRFYADLTDGKSSSELLCDVYPCEVSATYISGKITSRDNSGYLRICVLDDSFASADAFKTAMNGHILYYVLKTPIETPLTPEEVASIRALQTYKGTTVIKSEMDVASVSYSGDVKGYVDSKTDYSYTDTIIGKWADGKDLHRMVIQATTPSAENTDTEVATLPTGANVKRIDGTLIAGENTDAVNFYYGSTYYIATWVKSGKVRMRLSASYTSKPCEIIIEYTLKDSAPAAASVMSLDDNNEEETIIPSGVIVDDTVVLGGGK